LEDCLTPEDDLTGMQRVRASYKKQQVEVEFDENRVNVDQIIAAIQQMGYTVG
jgi:copper chaperone CopZ